MNGYEATKMVLSRIQSLDPENASKIMGYLLIQDQPEEEMIRLAFGPETHLLSFIDKAKSGLGFSSTTSSSAPSTPSSRSSFNPISNPTSPGPFPQSSPRVIIPTNNGFHMNPSSPWSGSAFSDHLRSPRPASSLSYAEVVNGTNGNGSSSGSITSFSVPFYGNGNNCSDLNTDGFGNLQSQEQIPFLDESLWKNMDFVDPIVSPSGRSDSILFPYGSSNNSSWIDSGNCEETHDHHIHRRSCSVSDAFLGGDDVGGGMGWWRPCMYFARGFCKNGNSCKFLHGGSADSADGLGAIVGSPVKIDGFDELLRMKAIQQQRFAAATQLMSSGTHPLPFNKCTDFFINSQRFGCCGSERNDFGAMGLGRNANSISRQIYLTFPADSIFKEEDVSSYFSKFGPVQDVRIPYQQKRMFGFVTFVFPETVRLILAKGNPHLVCDSRVLVKPYKEKGKVADKKQHQQQMDRDFPVCFSPTGLDSREPFDLPFRGRMLYNTHEMMLRRKLEEHAELQQAIELQERRLMNMQLIDVKNHGHNNQFRPNLSPGVAIPSPTQILINQSILFPSATNEEFVPEENNSSKSDIDSPAVVVDQKLSEDRNEASNDNNAIDCQDDRSTKFAGPDIHGSLDHILPDNLFASPTKCTAEENPFFSTAPMVADVPPITTKSSSNNVQVPPTTTLNVALKSCYLHMPRFCPGPETIEM